MPIAEHDWPTLSRLLDTALSLAPEKRSAWLEGLDREHENLKPMLRELLEREDLRESGDFLATLPKLTAAAPQWRSDAFIGQLIGPYRLERPLGSGGMGSVWLAVRIDGQLNRRVALKLPHLVGAPAGLDERLGRERDFLSGLEHPNIARLYDAGMSQEGRPYLALEYVEGVPIDRYCEQQGLDVAKRLELILQVARAVAYAHAHLIVHRDLKPSNIQVDAQGQVHLLDFGIAKLLVPESVPETPLTLTAGRVLTPDYASPEQIRGEPVSTASDVYSLGVVLYELLTGTRPHKSSKAGKPLALELAVLSAEPPRPSDAAGAPGMRRKLRGDLDTIVMKALKKDPRERYGAIVEFADDIERYLRGDPVRARPDSTWYRTRKFITRNKLPVGVAAGALIAVLATAVLALREAHRADLQRDRAAALSARAEAASDFQGMLITEAALSQKPVTVVDMLARSEALAKAEFSNEPEHLAAVLGMLGGNYHTMGEDGRAEPLLRDALQAVQHSPDTALRAKLTCQFALVQGASGKVAQATQALQEVIDDPQTSVEQSAQCLEDMAFLAQNQNDADGAVKYGTLAWQRLQQSQSPSPTVEGVYLGSIGYAYYLQDRNDEAERYYAQALKKFEQGGRSGSSEAISVRNNWAIVSDGSGNPKNALRLYDETLQLVAQNGPDATPPPYLIANRARALENIGRYEESRTVYAQCVDASTKAGNGAAAAYCLVGQCADLRELGDLSAAKGYCDQAAERIGKSFSEQSPPGVSLHICQGRIALSEGRLDEARASFTSVIGKPPLWNAIALIGRSEANLSAGKLAEAADDAQLALERSQSLQGGLPYSYKTGLAWLILGRIRSAQGDARSALPAFEAAVTHLSNTVDDTHPALREARRRFASAGVAENRRQ
jgi:serine/threonine-protein kinase